MSIKALKPLFLCLCLALTGPLLAAVSPQTAPNPNDPGDYSNQKRLEWLYQTRTGQPFRMAARINAVSIAAGAFADTELSAKGIPSFLAKNPSIKEMADEFDNPPGGLEAFKTFNAFFTRGLSAKGKALRPFDPSPDVVASPADSALFVIPKLTADSDIFVKGSRFNLLEFLGGDVALAKKYEGGSMMLFYLAPEDYHRFHFPFDVTITSGPKPISGYLDSVDPIAYTPTVPDDSYTTSMVPSLSDVNPFSKTPSKPYSSGVMPLKTNERQLLMFNSAFGDVVFVAIGAMMVGKIKFTYDQNKTTFKKGDEMGYFAFGGSTLVILFPPDQVTIPEKFVKPLPQYKDIYQMYTDDKKVSVGFPKTKVRLGEGVAKKVGQ